MTHTPVPLSDALAQGYTEGHSGDCDLYDLQLLVKPDTDLDDRFQAYDVDNEQWLMVNGWLFTFEPCDHIGELHFTTREALQAAGVL